MHTLNLFFILVILVSLFLKLKFSYVISLLCSLTAATFIHTQQNLVNILFTIALFNITPFLCYNFSLSWRKFQKTLQEEKSDIKSAHEQMLKERSLFKQANNQLSKEVFQILELYKMTRAMSTVLKFEDILTILAKKLMETFHFERCQLILIDEDKGALKINQVWELKYAQAHPQEVEPKEEEAKMLKQSLVVQKPSFLAEKSTCLAPLIADNKSLGVIAAAGLPETALEDFSILANQFALEFKRIRLYKRIQKLAITDGLTGLFGRGYFLERLREEIERSFRHNMQLGFLMVDIDHFKQCNDRFGHLTGDAILQEIAQRIKSSVRQIDLLGRYGGEEFTVLLPNTDKLGALNVAERIRTDIDRHKFVAYDETIKIEVSIGVAGFPQDANQIQDLIDKSDQALYRAKQEGRNRVCLYR